MKRLFAILFLFFTVKSFAQVANAGKDKTVYLTKGNRVTIGGRSSGTSYAWTKIYDVQPPQAGYPIDPATITSPSSANTTVTGLIQGVWYYQLAVTKGRNTKKDTVVVRVDYDLPPAGGTYFRGLPITNRKLIDSTNSRYDTIHDIEGEVHTSEGYIFFNRARLPGMMIDSSRGKFYSTVEDGYAWHGSGGYGTYARSEIHLQGSAWNNGIGIDSNKTYCFEWKGYFPQDFNNMKANQTAVVIMQIHADDGNSPPYAIYAINGRDGLNKNGGTLGVKGLYITDSLSHFKFIGYLDSFVNKTHTIRVTIREGKGYPGQTAFLKVEVDGVQKYFRNTGDVGRTWQRDYPKVASIYDYGNAFVDVNNHTRGRKFSLVTEAFRIYTFNKRVPVWPPVINTGGIEKTKKHVRR